MLNSLFSRIRAWSKERMLGFMYNRLMSPSRYFTGRRLFDASELKLLHQALMSQSLFGVDGKMVGNFEKDFARAYGVPYAVASTSGTAAIHTALGAIDMNPGDEVITAPITDLGTIIPILNQGGIPVFADIDNTFNMDPADVERKITSRTKAIIAVHLFGNPCDMDAMLAVARKHNIVLIEDCSQAHMTLYKGKFVGTMGDIGCFSFQQSKHMTTGDGGMTITNNSKYYEHMKLFVDKGFARKGWGARAYLFHGQNYRMNELTAAVGIAQLKKVANVIKKRNELGEYMTKLLSGIEGIRVAPITPGAVHSYWLYPLYYEGNDLEQAAKALKDEKVLGSIGYTVKPIYRCAESLMSRKTYGNSGYPYTWKDVTSAHEYNEGLCPKAEEALKHLFCINLNECWSRERIEKTAEGIRKVCSARSGKIAAAPKPVDAGKEKATPVQVKDTKKIRIGIVGCGLMGNMHLTAYKKNPDVAVVAYADTDPEKTKSIAQRVKGNVYTSHKEMFLKERLDGVSICTVPSTHREIVLDALEAGVNVLCEKPLAVSVAEAREMTEKASQKNKLLLTAFKFRFFEEVQQAKELLKQGSLGKITHFRLMFGGYLDMAGTWYANKNISGGGIIMDNGPHAIDLTRYLLGDIKEVSAQLTNVQSLDVEDTAHLNLTLESGATGTVDVSWSTSIPAQNYMEIYGENGTVLLDFKGISYKLKTWNEFKRVPNQLDNKGAFALQFEHFTGAIAGQKPTVIANEDGLKAQELIEKAYQSLIRRA